MKKHPRRIFLKVKLTLIGPLNWETTFKLYMRMFLVLKCTFCIVILNLQKYTQQGQAIDSVTSKRVVLELVYLKQQENVVGFTASHVNLEINVVRIEMNTNHLKNSRNGYVCIIIKHKFSYLLQNEAKKFKPKLQGESSKKLKVMHLNYNYKLVKKCTVKRDLNIMLLIPSTHCSHRHRGYH